MRNRGMYRWGLACGEGGENGLGSIVLLSNPFTPMSHDKQMTNESSSLGSRKHELWLWSTSTMLTSLRANVSWRSSFSTKPQTLIAFICFFDGREQDSTSVEFLTNLCSSLLFPVYVSNEAGCVFFSSACKLDTLLTVLTSQQTQHTGLKGWMSNSWAVRANNKTSIFQMSPQRLNSSVFMSSSLLIVCQHLAELHNTTHNGNTWKTDTCDICLDTCVMAGVFLWTCVLNAPWMETSPGNKCWHCSSVCAFLSITNSLSLSRETREDWAEVLKGCMEQQLICQKVHQDRGNNLSDPDKPFASPFSHIGCWQIDREVSLFPFAWPRKDTFRQLANKIEMGS